MSASSDDPLAEELDMELADHAEELAQTDGGPSKLGVLALDYRPPVIGYFRTACSLTSLRRGLRSWEWADRNLIPAPEDPPLHMPRARLRSDARGLVLKRGERIRVMDPNADLDS